MIGQRIGYKRVSTVDQNTARQLDGVELDKVFEDKISGKDLNRPQLLEAIDYCRQGDTLMVHSMDRLGRNVRDLLDTVEKLKCKGVTVTFLHPSLSFTGDDSPINKMLFLLLAGFAEMERGLIRERQAEGIAIAKKAKKFKGRQPALTQVQVSELAARKAAGEGVASLAREFNTTRQTVYAHLASATKPRRIGESVRLGSEVEYLTVPETPLSA
jgi:DNA invertase Pin-like site-specific DNA recombinase